MKTDNSSTVEKKITITGVFANQHPVINCWIAFSFIAIVALYAITLNVY